MIDAFNKIKPKNLQIDNMLFVYNKMQNKPLSKFLKVFLTKYDKTCGLFSYFYNDLYKKLGMYDFYKTTFCLYI